VIAWASTLAQNFFQSFQEPVNRNPRLWFTTTGDFQNFAAPQPFFDPNYAVSDGVILKDGARYALVHRDASGPIQDLRVAFASTPVGPWGPSSDAFAGKFAQAPSALKVGQQWVIWFVDSQDRRLHALETRDFLTFQRMSGEMSFPEGQSPHAVLRVRRSTVDAWLR
jgi:hypothetical protein